jgi:hypothetical protein
VRDSCFSNVTLKPTGRVRNGTHHNLQDRIKLAWANTKSGQQSSFLFRFSWDSSERICYHLVWEWIKNIILKPWTIWERWWFEFKWKLQTTGSFQLHHKMLTHTALSVREFLAKKAFPCFHMLIIIQICQPNISACAKIKIESQGLSLSNTWPPSEGYNRCRQDPKKKVTSNPAMRCKIQWAECAASEGCYFEGNNVELDV